LLINLNVKDLYVIIDKPEYAVGVFIVLLISIAELYKLSLGTNGAILTNSKYYRAFFYFSLAMALSVILLNKWLIEEMGIDGAALATFIVVMVFSTIKIIYIHSKLQMQPYSKHTIVVLGVILTLFFVFNFWNFPFHPIINIVVKTGLISVIYLTLIFKLRVSEDISLLIRKYLK